MRTLEVLTQTVDSPCFTARFRPSMGRHPEDVNARKIGIFGKRASESGRRRSILTVAGLVFRGSDDIIQATHSPCPSRFAVTHIKGEFLFCAPPNSPVEERT
jgi:hypothetical protein